MNNIRPIWAAQIGEHGKAGDTLRVFDSKQAADIGVATADKGIKTYVWQVC